MTDPFVTVGDLGPDTDWQPALRDVNTVIHLAGKAHVLGNAAAALADFHHANVLGTQRLAQCAAEAGVRRFIFVSSIGVNGNETTGQPFRSDDPPAPHDAYTRSKLAAEHALKAVAARAGLDVVIVRPPLVYGPAVPANFLRLLRLVDRGVPLPFGSVRNRRSLVYVENLASLLIACIEYPGAANRTFMVSDGKDLSTPQLIHAIAARLGRRSRLLPVPPPLLRLAGRLTNQERAVSSLCASLQVDIRDTEATLAWRPPHGVDTGLDRTVAWYRDAVRPAH